MKEIILTQGKVAIVDDEDYEYLSQWKWTYGKCGYAHRSVQENGKWTHLRMHRLLMSPIPEGMRVDHINRNTLDNRRSNLRICTHSQNLQNRPATRTNHSGYKGVTWDKSSNKWSAEITHNYKHIHIGLFDDIEDASKAYAKKAKELFGEFAYA